MNAKALWHLNSETSAWQEVQLLPLPTDHCLIQSLYSFISLGTEKTVATRNVPVAIAPSMQVPYMEGSFDLPIKYGYSLVGTIVNDLDPNHGKLVHLMHPHQSFCVAHQKHLTILPSTLPPRRATLISNMETALNATWDAAVKNGDKILIAGFGNIGALLACLIQQEFDTDLYILEPNKERRTLALEMGFAQVHENISEDDFNISFHTSGTADGLQTCINCLAIEGQVVELSWYGKRSVELQLGANFHQRRLKIISSQVSKIPDSHSSQWNFKSRKQKVIELLHQPIYDHLITHELNIEDAPRFFKQLRSQKVSGLGYCIKYPKV